MPEVTPIERETRRRHHADATRSCIVDAAEAVFVKKGFAAAAMTEIADRAGVTKSLIHHHFGSKQTLWLQVKRHRLEVFSKMQQELMAGGVGACPTSAS